MKIHRPRFVAILTTAILTLASASSFAASTCPNTPWESRNGRSCASIGLDSNRAVCRSGDQFAMMCDDTKTQIRTCASNQRCNNATAADVQCPKKVREGHKGKRACNAWEAGYSYGRRDVENGKRSDYERWDDKYDGSFEDDFKDGYRRGYRDYE